MDLYAYAQIEDLEKLLEMNGIKDIRRLRGLRLMSKEKPYDIKRLMYDATKEAMDSVAYHYSEIAWDRYYSTFDLEKFFKDYYCYGNGQPRWDRLHGKLRRYVKFEIKKHKRAYEKQYEMFNKYAGRDDVLYIHTRTGGDNWNYYHCFDYFQEPWYLDHCTDSWDCTYADIYAKIDPETVKKLAEMQAAEEANNESKEEQNETT